MPIYVKQTDKLGNINHNSKDMAKVYGKDMLVFQHKYPAGKSLIAHKPFIQAMYDTDANSMNTVLEAKGLYAYGTSVGIMDVSKLKNGLKILLDKTVNIQYSSQTSFVLETYDEHPFNSSVFQGNRFPPIEIPKNDLMRKKRIELFHGSYIIDGYPQTANVQYLYLQLVDNTHLTFAFDTITTNSTSSRPNSTINYNPGMINGFIVADIVAN